MMTLRAASIWFEVTRPYFMALMPYEPKASVDAARLGVRGFLDGILRMVNHLRCFTFLGYSMVVN